MEWGKTLGRAAEDLERFPGGPPLREAWALRPAPGTGLRFLGFVGGIVLLGQALPAPLRPAALHPLQNSPLAQPQVRVLGFQPTLAAALPEPLTPWPTAQAVSRPFKHDHGDQNAAAKHADAGHEANDEALRVHVRRSAVGTSNGGNDTPCHPLFVGD